MTILYSVQNSVQHYTYEFFVTIPWPLGSIDREVNRSVISGQQNENCGHICGHYGQLILPTVSFEGQKLDVSHESVHQQ